MRTKLLFAVTSIVVVSLGCGGSPADVSTTDKANPRDQTVDVASQVPLDVADAAKPDAIVAAFLDALRDGDDEAPKLC